MKCPECGAKNHLEWQLTACEFKCSNCGELFRICDLADKGMINGKI